eukprot:10866028-Karenia_brevis.AAC.1
MRAHVLVKVAFDGAGVVADLANKRLFSCMHADVLNKVVLLRTCIVAALEIADEWFFPGVRAEVHCQIPLIRKRSTTSLP